MEQVDYSPDASEFVAAMKVVRSANTVLGFLLAVVVLIPLIAFTFHQFGMLEVPEPAPTPTTGTRPAEAPAAAGVESKQMWSIVFDTAMLATVRIGPVVGALLILTLFFAAQYSLLEGSGGVAQFVGSFFWALVVMALLLPWKTIWAVSKGYPMSALYTLAELKASVPMADVPNLFDRVLGFLAVLAPPVAAFVLLCITELKFRRGFKWMLQSGPAAGQGRS